MIPRDRHLDQSTYCHALINHMHAGRRSAIAINLDPAAEKFHYQPTIDIRDLVTLEDVMEEMELGMVVRVVCAVDAP